MDAAMGPCGERWLRAPRGAERSPCAQRVALRLRREADGTVLEVRSRGCRGELVRELHAPAQTATHAARAVARHYGLVRIDPDRW